MRPEWIKTYDDVPSTRLEIRDEHLVGMELKFGTYNDHDIISRCHMEDCEITIENSSRVLFVYDRFDRCTFRPKKKVQCSWHENAWYDCVFHGHYVSTHFGILVIWKDQNPWGDILVRGCDFSKATMHGCSFKRADVSSISFPRWPCFTALRPDTNAVKWLPTLAAISPHFRTYFPVKEKDECDAVVFHWPTFAKNRNIELSFDEVKARLSSLDGILL